MGLMQVSYTMIDPLLATINQSSASPDIAALHKLDRKLGIHQGLQRQEGLIAL
jgi:hypothetical protein